MLARRRCRRALQDFAYRMPDELEPLRRLVVGHQDSRTIPSRANQQSEALRKQQRAG